MSKRRRRLLFVSKKKQKSLLFGAVLVATPGAQPNFLFRIAVAFVSTVPC